MQFIVIRIETGAYHAIGTTIANAIFLSGIASLGYRFILTKL